MLARTVTARAEIKYTITDLATTSQISSYVYSINAGGQIAGEVKVPITGIPHAYLWTPLAPNGTSLVATDLGSQTEGIGVNTYGQIAGSAKLGALLWSPTVPPCKMAQSAPHLLLAWWVATGPQY
jgi:hypothetical protein